MNVKELANEAIMLPIEQRVMLADLLLESINKKDEENQAKWAEVAKSRLDGLERGEVFGIDSKEVLDGAWSRLEG